MVNKGCNWSDAELAHALKSFVEPAPVIVTLHRLDVLPQRRITKCFDTEGSDEV